MEALKDWGITSTSDDLKLNDGDIQQVDGEPNYIYGLTKVDLKKGKNILVFPQRQYVADIASKSNNFSITEKYCDGDKEVDFNVAYCELTTTKDYRMQTGDLLANSEYVYCVVQGYNTNEVISIDACQEVSKSNGAVFSLTLKCSQEVLDKYGSGYYDGKVYYYKVTFPKNVSVYINNDIISSNDNEYVLEVRGQKTIDVRGLTDVGVNVTVDIKKC